MKKGLSLNGFESELIPSVALALMDFRRRAVEKKVEVVVVEQKKRIWPALLLLIVAAASGIGILINWVK